MRRKAEEVIHNTIIGSFQRLHLVLRSKVQVSQIAQICSAQKFQQPGRFLEVITPKLQIVSGHANNR
jgi:hypothetical protein